MPRWDRWNRGEEGQNSSNTYYYDENGKREDFSPEDYAYKTVMRNGRHKTYGWSLVSLILGIAGVACSSFGWAGMVFAALAVVFSLIAKRNLGYFNGMAVAGLVLGIFGFVCSVGILVLIELIPPEYFEEFFAPSTNGGGPYV